MAIDITGANAYFGPAIHIRTETWTKIPLARRIAALAQAKDLIGSRLDDDLETDATVAGDFPRHDAAVYEQALWMLETDALDSSVKAQVLNPQKLGGNMLSASVRAQQSSNSLIAPAAIRFLVVNSRSVRLSRG